MKAISADKLIGAETIDPRDFDYDDKYREFLDFFGEEDMGRYDVTAGILLDIDGTYVLGYTVDDDENDTEYYAIGDGKGNYLTLQDCSKFLRQFNKLHGWDERADAFTDFKRSLGVKPQSINDMEEEKNINDAKSSNLLVLDVPRKVLNWYNDVKKRDIVPFDLLVKAVQQWVDKAVQEQNKPALGEAPMALYKKYGIKYEKASGSWKKFKR